MASKAAAPHFIEQGKGTVINLASVAGTQEAARPGFSAYAPPKPASSASPNAWPPNGAPPSGSTALSPASSDNPKPTPGRTPAAIAERIKGIAAGRIGKNEDVGSAVVFLCDDSSEWINGAILPGGRRRQIHRPVRAARHRRRHHPLAARVHKGSFQ